MAANNTSSAAEEALNLLKEQIEEMEMEFPKKLRALLLEARASLGKPDASDKDVRSYIYREMYNFLARENEVGEGLSLIYPTEIVDAVRKLYPEGICDYKPKSRKRRNFYEVPLREFVEVYREGDLREDKKQ